MAVRTKRKGVKRVVAKVKRTRGPNKSKLETPEEHDSFFEGCQCFIMFDGSWDNNHCKSHKGMGGERGINPLVIGVPHSKGCLCNQCADWGRYLIRREKGLVE